MDQLIQYLQKSGVPPLIIVVLLAGYILADKFKLFNKIGTKSERELLDASQSGFREGLIEIVYAERKRGDASEADRAKIRSELENCERRHTELEAKFDEKVGELKDDLKACEANHAILTEGYNKLAAQFSTILESAKSRGIDMLFDIAEVLPLPNDLRPFLADVPETDRRKIKERRLSKPQLESRDD